MTDFAGCAVVMEAVRLLRALELEPRRTIRAVLFTNEENGLRGGKAYAERYGDVAHVSAAEMDSGAFPPVGYGVSGGEGAVAFLERLVAPLAVLGADTVVDGGGGADIGPLKEFGTPMLAHLVDVEDYFDYHHTAADTVDKVDPRTLQKNVASMAWVAWALAESDGTLPRLPPPDGTSGD